MSKIPITQICLLQTGMLLAYIGVLLWKDSKFYSTKPKVRIRKMLQDLLRGDRSVRATMPMLWREHRDKILGAFWICSACLVILYSLSSYYNEVIVERVGTFVLTLTGLFYFSAHIFMRTKFYKEFIKSREDETANTLFTCQAPSKDANLVYTTQNAFPIESNFR